MSDAVSVLPRARFDVACNDPDNGAFAYKAEQFQVATWDGAFLEFECVRRAPRFAELPGHIRFLRRKWPTLASKDWYGNWCWNAYWLEPRVLVKLLAAAKISGMFHCSEGPSQLFGNWNDCAELDEEMWMANLSGPHSIGAVDG
jgi:hypothetical protein